MSISPPPFSPPRSQSDGDDDDYVDEDVEQKIASTRTLVSIFDLYKNAIDQLRSAVRSPSVSDQKASLENFKPLTSRTNAWLYIRIHDDLIQLLTTYLKFDDMDTQSIVLSILANIAVERSSHEQIFETDLIDIVCQKTRTIDQIDIKNRCFRLLGNICTVEEAARKMIDEDLAIVISDTLKNCLDPCCLHSTIRCSRKLSCFKFCRDRMLDSMCLLSICKQLFSTKTPLKKEAMKAVLEWNVNNCDRSRFQLREGEIFRFLIASIESQTDKEYRHISLRLLDDLLRHGDMRTEFGHRQGLDFLMKMIRTKQYQSNYEHFKFLGLFCVCCQDVTNRRYIKEDPKKIEFIFEYISNYQYRSNVLDLLLTAVGQFLYDESSLLIFVKQMSIIEQLCDLLESVILVKYEINENPSNNRKRMKLEHQDKQKPPIMIDLNEALFTEFVENTSLDEERQNATSTQNVNIEHRRRTESLIFTILSKLSYETTDINLRRSVYNGRLVSLLLRYISASDELNPRSVRILYRLTKQIDCGGYSATLALPYLFKKHFHVNRPKDESNGNDDFLFDILIHDNRAFFQRLSWTSEEKRLTTIANRLMKNLEHLLNHSYVFNEIMRQLAESKNEEKFRIMLSLAPTLKYQHFQTLFSDRYSAYNHFIDQTNVDATLWLCKIFFDRFQAAKNREHLKEYIRLLQIHSTTSIVNEEKIVELNVNDEHSIKVNVHLLSRHSDYFQSLFVAPFVEWQQTKIFMQLPEMISFESFEHLMKILSNDNELIQPSRLNDLLQLCDVYLFKFLPFRLVSFALEQFIQGNLIRTMEIASKPNLTLSLIQAYFSHVLNSTTDVSTELFSTLLTDYSDQLQTLIRLTIQQTPWFHEKSPFLNS